jgi:bifunctional enzyme CysN/CysC
VAEAARLMVDAGLVVVVDTVSPREEDRARARAVLGEDFHEIFVDAPAEVCAQRAREAAAEQALASNQQPPRKPQQGAYEEPSSPALRIAAGKLPVEASVSRILDLLASKGIYIDPSTIAGGAGI